MSESNDGLPILPHLTSEFYTWLWWSSEANESLFELGEDVGAVELWMDERLAFRAPNETKVVAVMTGDNPSTTLESRAALAGGKVLQEIRIGFRRDDREFFCTLKGPDMHLQGLKLPQVMNEEAAEILYDRMFLYDEVCHVLAGLFREFCRVRTESEWRDDVLPSLQGWVEGEEL